jgi:predicted nucleic-acid-binding Zn-ribbon protein
MAPSKCPRCGSENFEVRELNSQDSKPKLTVQ